MNGIVTLEELFKELEEENKRNKGKPVIHYRSRHLCDVLAEMRSCHETRNYASLLALIEETQAMGNKMESSLEEKKSYERYYEEAKEAAIERNELNKQVKKLEKQIEKLEKKKEKLKQ